MELLLDKNYQVQIQLMNKGVIYTLRSMPGSVIFLFQFSDVAPLASIARRT